MRSSEAARMLEDKGQRMSRDWMVGGNRAVEGREDKTSTEMRRCRRVVRRRIACALIYDMLSWEGLSR